MRSVTLSEVQKFDISEALLIPDAQLPYRSCEGQSCSYCIEQQNILVSYQLMLMSKHDYSTGEHCSKIQSYFQLLMGHLMNTQPYQEELSRYCLPLCVIASTLHDIGKIALPESIVLKPSKLSTLEYARMKDHVHEGVRMIHSYRDTIPYPKLLATMKTIIYCHHEHWDGSGYPRGLQGDHIPIVGRIMSVVDVYDALTSRRPYKKALSHKEAVDFIQTRSATQFDPYIVKAFQEIQHLFEGIRKMFCTLENTFNPYF